MNVLVFLIPVSLILGGLGLAWFADMDTARGQEATPLVMDGKLYLTTAWSKVKAFDAATGDHVWDSRYAGPPDWYDVATCVTVATDGTVIAKELVLLKPADHADGSSNAVSGRGYFPDAFHGMDVMVKDSGRFAATNDWGFFNFGHHAPPYLERAKPAPAEACAACHIANATRDMMFTTYYPILE